MHVLPQPRTRRTAAIVLGATLVAATLTGCGDDDTEPESRQLQAANGVYRTSTPSGRSWWSSSSGSAASHSSQRGGFGGTSHGFSSGS